MAFPLVGRHWHLDDSNSIPEPQIRSVATRIRKGRYEGGVWDWMSAPRRVVNTTALSNYRFEIRDRSRTSLSGVVGDGAGTGWVDNSTKVNLPMATAAIGILTVGMVLKVEDEVVVVASVDRTAETIDVVSRGFGGSTAASHTDTTAFTVIGTAINDTDLKNVESFAEESGIYENYTQLYTEIVEQTYTDRISGRKGFAENPQLIEEAMDRLRRKMERGVIFGRKQAPAKTNNIPAGCAGILDQVENGGGVRTALRHNGNAAAFSQTLLKRALESCWAQGGNPDSILINPTTKRVISADMEGHLRINRDQMNLVGTDNLEFFQHEGRTLRFVEDVDWPTTRTLIGTEDQVRRGWRQGDALRQVEEPQDSSREYRRSLQGSLFVEVYGVGVDHIDLYNYTV